MSTTRNYGLILDVPDPTHYVFGSTGNLPMDVLQPDVDWRPFLPVKEYQNLNNVEPFACVSFTVLNAIEILIRRKYDLERNFSDRFLAAVSGTKAGGNSPQKVCETLRHGGIAMQEAWPFDQRITTFEKFYEEVPEAVVELAKEFLSEFTFKHDFVEPTHDGISFALKCSPLLVSVAAWHRGADGMYYRPPGATDNHATTLVYQQPNVYRQVFDSYADGEGDPSLKDVRWKDLPTVVKRFWIEKNTAKVEKKAGERRLCRFLSLLLTRTAPPTS